MKINTKNFKQAILIIAFAFFYNQSVFAQADTPCAAPLYTIGTSCNYTTFDASVHTKSTTATAPNPSCPNNQYTSFLAEEDTWYAFVAPAGGTVNISTARSTGSVYPYASAAVYSGACNSLTEIDCYGGYGGSSYPFFNLTGLTPGNTYYVRFWGLYANGATTPKTHDFCAFAPPSPPANDECSNAIPAVVDTTGYCNSTTSGTIEGATESPESYYCNVAGGGDANDDVWFSFVAIDTIQYFFLDNIAGSSTDLSFSVHAGTFCNSLGVNALACNQDYVTNLVVGNTYYVRVWSNSSAAQNSTFDLCITAAPVQPSCAVNPPAGNTACLATPICNLDGYCGTTSATYTEDSWPELDVAALCFPDIDNNSFLELTAADTAISFWVWVDNCNFPNGIQIMVFSADSCGGGPVTVHSCWSPNYVPPGAALVSADGLTVGDTYYIMVDGNAGAICDYTIAAYEGFQTAVEVNSISGDTSICLGSSIDLFASGGSGIYTWSPGATLNNITTDTVTATPVSTGSITYMVTSTSTVAICPNDTADFTLVTTDYITVTDVQIACDSAFASNTWFFVDTMFNDTTAILGSCDSITVFDININNSIITTSVSTSCDAADVGIDTTAGLTALGCDSTHYDTVTLSSVILVNAPPIIACDSAYASNIWFFVDTMFNDTTAILGGCDSVTVFDISINNSIMTTSASTSCDAADVGIDTTSSLTVLGCDSLHYDTVTLAPTNIVNEPITACDSAFASNTWFFVDTMFNDTTAIPGSCDSITVFDININNSIITTSVSTSCDVADVGIDTTAGLTALGCDSTHYDTVTLSSVILVNAPPIIACDSAFASNTWFFVDTMFNDTTAILGSCDSVTVFDININNSIITTSVSTSCDVADVGIDTTAGLTALGCDSTHYDTVTLTSVILVNAPPIIACDSAFASNTWFYVDTMFNDTTAILGGCDSVTVFDININHSIITTSASTSCDAADVGIDTTAGLTALGCDSLHYDTVSLAPTSVVAVPPIIACDSAFASNTWFYVDTMFNDTTAIPGSCDSITIFDISINHSIITSSASTSCNAADVGIDMTPSLTALGCDSTHYDTVTLAPAIIVNVPTISGCDSAFANSTWFYADTLFNDTISLVSGCDSVAIFNIIINNPVMGVDFQNACETFIWIDGNTYTESNNTATFTIPLINGCDSIVALNLTILSTPNVNPIASEDSINLGSEVILSVLDSGLNYQWSNGGFGAYTAVSPTETEIFNVIASNGLCSDTGYIEIIVFNEEVKLFIPNAFSPNGDGENDLFRIINSEDFIDISLQIYNRWGELIFNDINNNHAWDGTYKSTPQNIGLYIYSIEATSKTDGQKYSVGGNVTLIR